MGSDIAVDAADIVLVNDRVEELPHLLALSRRMMTTIRLNLAFSMALNLVAIVLAMTGVLNPVVGALVHNAGSVLVIIHSAFLLHWKAANILQICFANRQTRAEGRSASAPRFACLPDLFRSARCCAGQDDIPPNQPSGLILPVATK